MSERMDATISPADILTEIESRQDDVLQRLDALNALVEKAIAEWLGPKRIFPAEATT